MIEARIFTDSIDGARARLEKLGAKNQGDYEIIDTIFHRTNNSIPIAEEFLRLRVLPINIWPDKQVVLAVKKTELQTVGKNSEIPLKKEFDVREEAQAYYDEHLSSEYVEDFSFSRIGWQYFLPNGDVVDLEVIENKHPSIEFKSKTPEGIDKLLDLFDVSHDDIIKGPSVMAVKEILNR